jgi:hypothetical protein
MTMIKKMMLLAGMALALVAVAAPASASANWLHGGNPITTDQTVEFSGPARFFTALGGAEATIHVHATLKAGTTTAVINKFEATNCKGTGGLAGTTCTTTAKGLPWTAHVTPSNQIEITDVELHNLYWAGPHSGGPVATTTLIGDITATPDDAEAISSVSLSSSNATANGNPAVVEGTLGVSPAGTYGLEG